MLVTADGVASVALARFVIDYKDTFTVSCPFDSIIGHRVRMGTVSSGHDWRTVSVDLLLLLLLLRLRIIHRLDRKTSGVLLFALDEETLKALQLQFAERRVYKA